MEVVKKNGSIQDFDIEKIKTSLINCKCAANCSMTEGYINAISTRFKKVLSEVMKDRTQTSTYEIRAIVHHVLVENGFKDVAKAYMGF